MESTSKGTSQKPVGSIPKSNSSEETLIKHEIKDTPFFIIEDRINNIVFAVMGNHRLTEPRELKNGIIKEVEQEVSKLTWNRIIQVMLCLQERHLKASDLMDEIKIKNKKS